jgi:transcription termination factor Rho
MSVLDRGALEESPLADLHAIASDLSIDGYRRLRRPDLIQAILDKQDGPDEGRSATAGGPDDGTSLAGAEPTDGGDATPARTGEPAEDDDTTPAGAEGPGGDDTTPPIAEEAEAEERKPARRRRQKASVAEEADDETQPSGRGEPAEEDEKPSDGVEAPDGEATESSSDSDSESGAAEEDRPAPRRRRGRRGGRGRPGAREESARSDEDEDEDEDGVAEVAEAADEAEPQIEGEAVEGVVELLPNGSGFVRVEPPEPSDDDVYISAAQVKRCELVSGDRISGPKRAPRRSERFASLIRIDAINGRPAAELADSVRFDDLPAAFPDERFRLGSEDPTVKAIEWLTPFGKGSRVMIVGQARSGKTEALRRLAAALAEHEELALTVVLAGVRPEEISELGRGPLAPAVAVSFAASPDAQSNAIEPVIDQARRLAARGADAVVLIDTLDGLPPQTARKILAAARNILDGGSLTIVATGSAPVGGETTVIALDASLASTDRFPALDLVLSGTMRPELLVGEAGAEAIARTRAEAMDA